MWLPLLLLVADAPAPVEHFEKHVRPVLVEKCQACHGPTKQRGGLRLDTHAGLLKGGDSGSPAVVPNHPEKSLLLRAVRCDGDLKMPPKEADRLTRAQIDALEAWIKVGAPWPAEKGPAGGPSPVALARKTHWAFKPVVSPPVPAVKGHAPTPIDRFVLAKLEAKGLTLSPEADRRTLLRRLTFDLTGLPPTPEEVDDFLADKRPDAYERVVDRLLASPAYGERWGRHWLDLARYADTKGYVFTEERRFPYSYTYRDYVIDALNRDLPYDQFLLQQLAADQLPLGDDKRPLAAMGYLTLGRRFLNNVHDIIDDRIDTVTRGLLGLTVSCARCHDHKFDPIPTRDYYSLHGVFLGSVEPRELPLLDAAKDAPVVKAFEVELAKRQAVLNDYLAKQRDVTLDRYRKRVGEYLLATRATGRTGFLNRAMVQRWRTVLDEARRKPHPVLAPWLALPGKVPAGQPVNPLVAKALDGVTTHAEAAKRYQKLFDEVNQPKPHADKDREEVRRVLHGPGSVFDIPAADIRPFFDRAQRDRAAQIQRQIDQWRATGPGAPPRAMVLVDAPSPAQARVLVRGNPGNPGVTVPRQFLEVLSDARKPFGKGSGRLELAQAIASKDNPLTARVMVNRVWMHHFGAGIVRTPGDFGTRGDPPTHPELLDWLAAELMADGWSVKGLHRRILLSAAYRQQSDDRAEGKAADPENLLLWRYNRRRLELEPMRDALLAVAGRLDRRMGGPGVEITAAPYPPRRSVYAFIERQNLPGVFRTFDLASPDASTPQRHSTTVPQQALFLMNSPFTIQQARAFAARPELAGLSDAERIDRMHRLAYGRPADADERELGLAFVAGEAKGGLSAWEQYAQVLLLANELAFVD